MTNMTIIFLLINVESFKSYFKLTNKVNSPLTIDFSYPPLEKLSKLVIPPSTKILAPEI